MRKTDLVKEFSKAFNVTQSDAESMISYVLDTCHDKAIEDKHVYFGNHKFERKDRAARKGRNLATGETIHIPGKTIVQYRNFGE